MKTKLAFAILVGLFFIPVSGYSQALSNYLILQDVGPYKLSQPKELIPGVVPIGGPRVTDEAGILAATGHFPDHADKTYELKYLGGRTYASPTVEITQHTGGDSDRWLLHEIEKGYRSSKAESIGSLNKGAFLRTLNGNKILQSGTSGGTYRWLSNNNVVVQISYYDADFTKPEPKEVIAAYLTKFPSVIPATFKLNSTHDIEWIKDEIDRRLWLCDKWVSLIQPGDAELYDKLDSVLSNMNTLLDFRQKYFGISAKDDKILLLNYYSKKDDASIKAKLTEYKTWWTTHKADPISL
jgi:hypothetical protein